MWIFNQPLQGVKNTLRRQNGNHEFVVKFKSRCQENFIYSIMNSYKVALKNGSGWRSGYWCSLSEEKVKSRTPAPLLFFNSQGVILARVSSRTYTIARRIISTDIQKKRRNPETSIETTREMCEDLCAWVMRGNNSKAGSVGIHTIDAVSCHLK